MSMLLLIGALLCAAPAAKPADTAKPAALTKAKEGKIRKLLHVTKADLAGSNMLANLKAHVSAAQYDRAAKLINPADFTDHFVDIYHRHFSEQDIDGLLAFYGTPLGQRLIAEGPGISQESVE